MPVFQIGKDFETSERVGARDMFQISAVIDQDENNIANQIKNVSTSLLSVS